MTTEERPETPLERDELTTEFVLEAYVTLAPREKVGGSKYGQRQFVPITGGKFEGPKLSGEVLSGTDWQVVRADGVIEMDAQYSLRASDGTVIQVRNRGIVVVPKDARAFSDAYVRTVPEFEAPSDGPHAWLNCAIFLGRLVEFSQSFVRVRMYKVL